MVRDELRSKGKMDQGWTAADQSFNGIRYGYSRGIVEIKNSQKKKQKETNPSKQI